MPCELYKDALIDAAASGAVPSGELRAHLAECDFCREAFAQEQSLFAAIDSALHNADNTEVPPSLLPRVRARLDEAVAPRSRWVPSLVSASASVALALAIFLLAHPHHTEPGRIAKQSPVDVPAPRAPSTKTNPERVSWEGTQIAIRVNSSHVSHNSTNSHSVPSSNLEVLVPPDEREGLAHLVAMLNEPRDSVAFLAPRAEKKDALVTVDPLQTAAIEIRSLDGTETEAPDGAGEEH